MTQEELGDWLNEERLEQALYRVVAPCQRCRHWHCAPRGVGAQPATRVQENPRLLPCAACGYYLVFWGQWDQRP